MILTCPRCATRYLVDDAQIAPSGRTVRCAACHESWTAGPGTATVRAEATRAPTHAKSATPLFAAARPKPRPGRRSGLSASPWAVGAIVALVLLVVLAFVLRTQLVQLWLA